MKKVILILCCLFFLVGCNDDSSNSLNQEKIRSEVEYFSAKIADLLNKLNNITLENYELVSEKVNIDQADSSGSQSKTGGNSQSENSQSGESGEDSNTKKEISVTDMQTKSVLNSDTENIDWDYMRNQIELINTSWSIAMLDLSNANVQNQDIIGFGETLNNTILSIRDENKPTTLTNLSTLYSYLPKFLNSISAEKHIQNIENTKYYILTAYVAASQDDWNTVNTNLTEAETNFLRIVNDTEYSKNKEFKINKIYMLIKDIQNSVTTFDKELFFVKYKNLIENLNTLS